MSFLECSFVNDANVAKVVIDEAPTHDVPAHDVPAHDVLTPQASPVVAPALSLRLFGTLALEVRGQPVPSLSRAARALIGLLAIRGSGWALERDVVCTMLWPESDEAAARYNLRRILTEVRDALGPEVHRLITTTGTARTLRLDLASVTYGDVVCDVTAFDAAIARGGSSGNGGAGVEDALRMAVTLYESAGGALLEGERGEWIFPEREARLQAYLNARERLARQHRARGEADEALWHLLVVLRADPTRETVVRELMLVLSENGQATAALAAYQALRGRLQKEVDAVPDAETTALYKRLHQKARQSAMRGAERGPDEASRNDSRKSTPETVPSQTYRNLPRPLTALIGRDCDVVEVGAYLNGDKDQPPVRLVTLVGSGGVGKTRLAVAVAESALPDYESGVCFVDLAPLSEPSGLLRLIALALRMPEQARRDDAELLERMWKTLYPQQMLLLLDNCEHLSGDVARLALSLLQNCPRLTILATSREPLHAPGEVTWRVPSLDERAAMRLFVDRAEQANPAFRLTESNHSQVRHIALRLDGIPLAIEMAAARVRALPVAQIAARLEDVFRLLGSVPGGSLLPRHQTFRATLDWSYQLLSPAEQMLLARLSVFAGGWTLAAAEAVGAGGPVAEADVLDLLASLIDKSLVQFIAGDSSAETGSTEQGRYRLLETVRQYSGEKLTASGDRAATRRRHRLYFLSLAEEIAPTLKGDGRKPGLDRLEADHENLRAALRRNDAETGEDGNDVAEAAADRLKLAVSLCEFWNMSGYFAEGYAFIFATRAEVDTCQVRIDDVTTAHALLAAGVLAYNTSKYDEGRVLCQEAQNAYQALGDQQAVAQTLLILAGISFEQNNRVRAKALNEEILAIYQSLQDHQGVVGITIRLSVIARTEGHLAEARQLCEDCLKVVKAMRQSQNDDLTIYCLNHLAAITWLQRDGVASRQYAEESLTLARKPGYAGQEIWALINLGNALKLEGDLDRARHFLEEAYTNALRTGSQHWAVHALEQLSEIAARQRDFPRAWSLIEENFASNCAVGNRSSMIWALFYKFEIYLLQGILDKAALLYGAFETLSVEVGALLLRVAKPMAEIGPESLRVRLGDAVFDALQAQGRHLTLEEAVALPPSG